MQGPIIKTTAVFCRPFNIPGFGETLPAGEYDLETEISAPPDHRHPERWTASVLVRVNPRMSHPGLARSLKVPLAAIDHAAARDKLTGRNLVDFFLEAMLADPMVRLAMAADRVTVSQLRQLYAPTGRTVADHDRDTCNGTEAPSGLNSQDAAAVQRAENEGMPPRSPPGRLAMTRQMR